MVRIGKYFLTLTLLLSMTGGFTQWTHKQETARTYTLAKQIAGIQTQNLLPTSVNRPSAEDFLKNTNLKALRQVNPDVIGWIMIPDTKLSYPIVQGNDNNEYLYHAWDRKADPAGSIFLDSELPDDFLSFHTILYGHRMKDDSMFGSLKYYDDFQYWKAHPSIYLVSDLGVARYDIFAVYEAAVTDITYALSLPQRSLRRDFILFSLKKSIFQTGIYPELTDGVADKILTLSTCTGHGYENRWVVSAVLRSITDSADCNTSQPLPDPHS